MANNNNNIAELQAKTEHLNRSVTDLNTVLDDLQKKQEGLAEGLAKCSGQFKEGATNIAATTAALKALTMQLDEQTKALASSKASMQQNKDLLAALMQQYDGLSRAQFDNSKQGKDLNAQIAQLSVAIADQEQKLAKSRQAFDFHKESVKGLNSAFDSLKKSNKDFGPVLEEAAKGFNAMKTGISAIKTGFQGVGAAIKTTGFGLLILALQTMVEYFTKNSEGIKVFKGLIASVGLIIEKIKKVISGLSEGIIDAISHPAETFKKIWNAVIENITNRFKGIKVFFEGLFSGDFKKMGDGVIQMATGVTDGIDKIKKAYNGTKKLIAEGAGELVKAYEKGANAADKATKKAVAHHAVIKKLNNEQSEAEKEKADKLREITEVAKTADDETLASIARVAVAKLKGYAREIADAEDHYRDMLKKYTDFIKAYEFADEAFKTKYKDRFEASKKAAATLETEKNEALLTITQNFQQQDLKMLDGYQQQLTKISSEAGLNAKDLAIKNLREEENAKQDILDEAVKQSVKRTKQLNDQSNEKGLSASEVNELNKKIATEQKIREEANAVKKQMAEQLNRDIAKINNEAHYKKDVDKLTGSIQKNQNEGHFSKALQEQKQLLDMQYTAAVAAATKKGDDTTLIETNYAKKKADLENQLTESRIHAGDKFINAVLANTKKDSALYKAAFLAKKATAIADTIMSTKQAVMDSLKAYSGIPFIGQALGIAQAAFMAVQGATSIAAIAKQKPGFATGGQFVSDGRGALLPGYSKTDNTNAHLRSGEAVVVSEAMRNPWARNLVSAINVAHGGRDFSAPNTGRGYAIGGIFTDGGNANRYYNQPAHDVRDLANTLAYQMINNFPPIYVDVKDVNNQQNILAQTVNRVNL